MKRPLSHTEEPKPEPKDPPKEVEPIPVAVEKSDFSNDMKIKLSDGVQMREVHKQ